MYKQTLAFKEHLLQGKIHPFTYNTIIPLLFFEKGKKTHP